MRRFVWLVIVVSTACSSPSTQLNADSPYAQLIGAEYRIVGEVKAYGIYTEGSTKSLWFVTLIPGIGIGGREVAFERRVEPGQIIRILSAWHRPVLSASGFYYLVSVDGVDWARDVPVRIELMRGNEGVGPQLNPKIYERIER